MSLRQRIAALVFVPLVVQLLLLGLMAGILFQAQVECGRLERSKRIVFDLHRSGQKLIALSERLGMLAFHRDEKAARELYRELDDAAAEFQLTEELLERERDGDSRRFSQMGDFLLSFTRESLRLYLLDDLQARHFARELKYAGISFNQLIDQLSDRYAMASERSIAQQLSQWRRIQMLVSVAAGVGIIFGAGLFLHFKRTIFSRLNLLKQNMELLVARAPLLPAQTEADELGELDRLFHAMAGQIGGALERLERSEGSVKAIVDGIPEPLLTVSAVAEIDTVNPRAVAEQGFTLAEFRQRSLLELVTSSRGNSIDSLDAIRSLNEGTWLRASRKDGSWYPAEVRVTDLEGLDPPRYLVHLTNVSERLADEQWKQDFVSMLSHDLRTPLQSVRMSLECFLLNLYGKPTDDGVALLEQSVADANEVISIVNDLLLLEKSELEKVQKDEEIDLEAILKEAVSSACFEDRSKKLVLKPVTIHEDECLIVMGDGEQLLEAFRIIFGFSMSKTAGESVEVSVSRSPVVSVCASGLNVDLFRFHEIFNKYAAIPDNIVEGRFSLKLALCASIVRAHGGDIQVRDDGAMASIEIRFPSASFAEPTLITAS